MKNAGYWLAWAILAGTLVLFTSGCSSVEVNLVKIGSRGQHTIVTDGGQGHSEMQADSTTTTEDSVNPNLPVSP